MVYDDTIHAVLRKVHKMCPIFLLTPYYSMNNDAQTFTTTANRNRVKILIE